MNEELENARLNLQELLALMEREYQKAREPYVKRLVEIEALRVPAALDIDISPRQANAITFFPQANAEPVMVFHSDGEITWMGRKVTTDEELKAAVIALVPLLQGLHHR